MNYFREKKGICALGYCIEQDEHPHKLKRGHNFLNRIKDDTREVEKSSSGRDVEEQ